jgi:hypothetical protein
MTASIVGSGISTQFLVAPEGTYGVAPTLTAGTGVTSYEIKSETLEGKKTTVQGEGLHAGGKYARTRRRVLTNWDVNGGWVMDLPCTALNRLLRYMVGSTDQSVFATNGNLIENSTTNSWTAVHIPGNTQGASLCVQKGVTTTAQVVQPFTYVGVKLSDWEIACQTGEIAQLTITADGRNELAGLTTNNGDPLNTTTPALATWANHQSNLFHFRQATLSTGAAITTTSNVSSGTWTGLGLGQVKSISIKQTMALDTSRYFLGSAGYKAEQIENGLRSISGTFVIEWDTEAMYEAYTADTPTSLLLEFTGIGIGSGSQKQDLQILIPSIKLDGEAPKVGGPAVITQSVNFTGLDDEVNNPIQITYTTLDTGDTDTLTIPAV